MYRRLFVGDCGVVYVNLAARGGTLVASRRRVRSPELSRRPSFLRARILLRNRAMTSSFEKVGLLLGNSSNEDTLRAISNKCQ